MATKRKKEKHITGAQIVSIRKALNINQQQFWSAIGITQSGGSRYENGRTIPASTVKLLRIACANSQDALDAAVEAVRVVPIQ